MENKDIKKFQLIKYKIQNKETMSIVCTIIEIATHHILDTKVI